MKFVCKTPECPSKGQPQETIIVTSVCYQTLNLETDDWTDLEVQDTLYGQCKECATKIPVKTLDKLIERAGEE